MTVQVAVLRLGGGTPRVLKKSALETERNAPRMAAFFLYVPLPIFQPQKCCGAVIRTCPGAWKMEDGHGAQRSLVSPSLRGMYNKPVSSAG